MGRTLQFRCVNPECPGNYQIMALKSDISEQLSKMGAFEKPSAGKCQACGKGGLYDTMPQVGTDKQKQTHNELFEDLTEKFRATARLLNDLLPNQKGAAK